ncbi:MAG: 3-phosphoshikimate 1-carboxyvinyltransferase [Candidatus Promineifilaceae bacterium]|nr:3-phosphoshikimate 1-carboxyvinyltransferase [Candidatus Promineifilaceae bacterium]
METPSTLRIVPQKKPLAGTIHVPGDKSISHRAVILAAVADGISTIRNWLPAGDTLATLDAVRALGVQVEIDKHSNQTWDLEIKGQGLQGLVQPTDALNLRNAGTGLRLMAGLMAGQDFPVVLDGSSQLRKRPMRRIIDPLTAMGAKITSVENRVPLHIQPAPLYGIRYEMNVASAQVKSAILLAALYATGETHIFQPGPARDHTERMLRAAGVPVEEEGNWIRLKKGGGGIRELQPLDLTVPGDVSSAAFPLVAAAIVPHSQVTIVNIGANDTRTGLFDMLRAMGASFTITNERITGGEPAVDLTVRFDELHATDVSGATVVRGIDEFPIWAVAATQAAGVSLVQDAAELRVKEVDRISVLAGELLKMGVPIQENDDGFTIAGPLRLSGAEVNSHDDHRLAMSLAVAGLVASSDSLVHDAGCARDSFPGFVETMQQLGAQMMWET